MRNWLVTVLSYSKESILDRSIISATGRHTALLKTSQAVTAEYFALNLIRICEDQYLAEGSG